MNNYYLPFLENDEVIELGGGDQPIYKKYNTDCRQLYDFNNEPVVAIIADLSETLPIEDNRFDGCFSKFAVEHISFLKTKQLLSEVYRILKPGGKFVFIVPNTLEQMRWVINRYEEDGTWDIDSSRILYGTQDYKSNYHCVSIAPSSIIRDLQELNFQNILVIPFGEPLMTDMIIECQKPEKEKNMELTRKEMYDKNYFNGGTRKIPGTDQNLGGYAFCYQDFYNQWVVFKKIMDMKPESVLEIGTARGYLIKRLNDAGIPSKGVDVSHHCRMTRACEDVIEMDLCEFPWSQFKDGEFDIVTSTAVLEHIEDKYIDDLIKELNRISKRGFHLIDTATEDDGFDHTHVNLKPLDEYWRKRMPKSHICIDKEVGIRPNPGELIHDYIPSGDGTLKINLGSYISMHHYGWLNIDGLALHDFAKANYYKFYQADLRQPLSFLQDNSVSLGISNHCLEHMTAAEGEALLRECYRVMKPGATFRVIVPDAELLTTYYQNRNMKYFNEINDPAAESQTDAAKLWKLMFEGHFAAYDWETLKAVGEKVGFKAERRKFREGNEQILRETIDMQPELSLYVEFIKP